MMNEAARVQQIAEQAVARHDVPGVVTAIAGLHDASVGVAGERALGGAPMTRDTVFRIASVTKPIVAAAALVLVDRGVLRLDAPVAEWLPELAQPRVLREAAGPLDDTVPAESPILVEHLLSLRAGLGFGADFGTPLAQALHSRLHQGPPDPAAWPDPDTWLAAAAALPLAHQPGAGWTYNTGFDIAGVLLARAGGGSLGDVLADTLFTPLGMVDTAFRLGAHQLARTAASYRPSATGLDLVDPPEGAWSRPIPFESGAGGLVSTLDDLIAFGRMLAAGGQAGATRVLSEPAVARMLTPGSPSPSDDVFLAGQSWSLGGSVDVVERRPWEVRGRYGWAGGTGTALYVYPRSQRVAVWLTQRELAGPDDDERLGPVLTLTAEHER